MAISINTKVFTRKEENLNILTHAIGLCAGVAGTVLLFLKSNDHTLLALFVYSFTLILVYLSSTLVHSAKKPSRRKLFNTLDHIAVDLLIAGTYTSLVQLKIPGKTGTAILAGAWLLCLVSVTFKVIYKDKPQWFSEICYLFLSVLWLWAYQYLTTESIILLITGITSYVIGLFIYKMDHIPYNHPVFHVFVLLGSTLHFLQIYYCCL
ncbi:MAG: hemolysin III family protein [Flavobacteriales bacterium]